MIHTVQDLGQGLVERCGLHMPICDLLSNMMVENLEIE